MVSPGWVRAVAVIGATVMLLAASCTWQLSLYVPEGLPPPPGDAVPMVDTHAGGRPADQLRAWAERRAAALEIPVIALEAYAYATRVAEVENPKCHLGWTTLAGIGEVESHHGTYRGAKLSSNGDVSPPIRGVSLDGSDGNLRILDGAAGHDGPARAMGPMQFIPETWRLYGVDAHNDGRFSPDNIDDAALTAAGYLCWSGKDLATPSGWLTALRAYNNSTDYARAVRDWAAAYATGHPL